MQCKGAMLFLLLTHCGWLAAQTNRVGGAVAGAVVDDRTGRGIAGAKIYALLIAPRMASTAEVAAAVDGAFALNGIGAGTYRLCASAGATYAPGCLWLDRSTDLVTVNWGQTVAGVVVRLKRGSKLTVRVDDAGGNWRRREAGKVTDVVLLLSDGRGNQRPLIPTRMNAAGTDYETTIPEDTTISLSATAAGLIVEDEERIELGPQARAYGFVHAAATPAAQRKGFRFRITGRR